MLKKLLIFILLCNCSRIPVRNRNSAGICWGCKNSYPLRLLTACCIGCICPYILDLIYSCIISEIQNRLNGPVWFMFSSFVKFTGLISANIIRRTGYWGVTSRPSVPPRGRLFCKFLLASSCHSTYALSEER